MRDRALMIFCGMIALGGSAMAFEFKPTPIESEFRRSVMSAATDPSDVFNSKSADSSKSIRATQAQQSGIGRKSLFKAVLWSTLVPGGGEYYLGERGKARVFFSVEAATWLGFASFELWGHWKKNDYIQFAAQRAGAQLEGKSDNFDDLVGFYTDITEYNTLGRVSDPERAYLYDTPTNHWRWQSATDQATYRTIKNQSREAFRRAKFMIGLAVVSRVVSVIDAILDTRRLNRAAESSFSQSDQRNVEFVFNPLSSTGQVALVIHTGW